MIEIIFVFIICFLFFTCFFKHECKHPFRSLMLRGKPTIKRQKGCDYNVITYHITCAGCKENLTLERSQAIERIGDKK